MNPNFQTFHFFRISWIFHSEMATLGLQNDFVDAVVWAKNIPLVSARPIPSFLLDSHWKYQIPLSISTGPSFIPSKLLQMIKDYVH